MDKTDSPQVKESGPHLWWWLGLGAASVAAGFLAQTIRLPGGWLIGPLLVAIVAGLSRPEHPRVSSPWFIAAQAVIGTILASRFRPDVLPLAGANWLPILLVVTATLGVGLGSGVLLARIGPLDRETATFGTLPGGAASMIAMSIDLGADGRIVALMQYLRVVLVVLSASFLARFVLHPSGASDYTSLGIPSGAVSLHLWRVYVPTLLLAAVGAWAGRRVRLPAGGMIGPLILGIVTSGLNILHPLWPFGIPQAAYIIIGLYVGLLFDRASLRQAGRLIPVILANTFMLMIVCAATGKVFSSLTGTDYLTGYLATTPGGMDSIAVVALGSGSNVSLILTVQMVRLLAIVLAGPLLAKWMLRRGPGRKFS
ncbi:MAG: AbrB family transcriptional regulator [bacterium]|nr:AbrB family transcriptional regulator [bacterium]